jgi:hypothetical protein
MGKRSITVIAVITFMALGALAVVGEMHATPSSVSAIFMYGTKVVS